MQECGPIFIGGLDNSGKTALRLALSSHPRIAMTRRSYMWTRVYRRYGDLANPDAFERCLAALLSMKDVQAMQPDADRIRQEFAEGNASYGRLFALLHQQFAERLGKQRWGEQEGHLERFAADIFAEYPDARVIHMLRDPRNRYEEMLLSTPPRTRPGRVGVSTRDWLQSARLARYNEQVYAGRYRIFRYEELHSEPERALRQVCAFVGEDYMPGMLSMENAIRFGDHRDADGGNAWQVEDGRGTQRAVSHREVAFMQAFAGREMRAWGYALQNVRLGAVEALHYCAVDLPLGVTRMILGQ